MNSTVTPSTSASHYLSSQQDNVVVTCIAGFLSILGTSFIIITYFIWKDIQTSSRRILVFLSIADFFSAVANIVGLLARQDDKICLVQGIIGAFFILSSFFWTVFLAVYLFVGCTRRKIILAERLTGVFHIIGWGVPFIIICMAAISKKFGNSGDRVTSGWCWIDTTKLKRSEQIKWMLITGKFWEVSAFVIISVLYILIKRGMRQDLKSNQHNNLELSYRSSKAIQTAERKLVLVPLSFMLLRIWGTVRFLIFVFHGKADIRWLIIMQGFGDNAPGFFNFLIFCFFTEKVLSQIQRVFCRCCYKLCPGLVLSMKSRTYDTIHPGICEPISTTTPDYQTFEKSVDGDLCESCATN